MLRVLFCRAILFCLAATLLTIQASLPARGQVPDAPAARALEAFALPGGAFEQFVMERFAFSLERLLSDRLVSNVSNASRVAYHSSIGAQEEGVPWASVQVVAETFELTAPDSQSNEAMDTWIAAEWSRTLENWPGVDKENFIGIGEASCGDQTVLAQQLISFRQGPGSPVNGGSAYIRARVGSVILAIDARLSDNMTAGAPRVSVDHAVMLAVEACRFIVAAMGPAEQPEVLDIAFFDANPTYAPDGSARPEDWRPSDLLRADQARLGAAADGESRLIVRAELDGADKVAFVLPDAADGTIIALLDGETIQFENKYYAFALYRPPENFDEAAPPTSTMTPPARRHGDVLEVRGVAVAVVPAGGGAALAEKELLLARPPVVLVHGLFSDPLATFVDTFADGTSMVAVLEAAGLLPFLVNYEDSNGSWDVGYEADAEVSWLSGPPPASSFEANRTVVWDSPSDTVEARPRFDGWFAEEPIRGALQVPETLRVGGISEALDYYRSELELAATQADVIGHSMGGLLARIWASETYNPAYLAPHNFDAGDINRLVTLNTPHHGSEMPELRDALATATLDDEPWLAWARRRLLTSALNWFFDPEPGAVSDLRPGSQALRRIGPTPIPSLAIATVADASLYGDPNFDPYQLYNSLYAVAGTLFFQNRALLDRFVETRFIRWRNTADPFRKDTDWQGRPPTASDGVEGIAAYAGTISANLDSTAYFWAMRRDAEFEAEMRQALAGVVRVSFGILSADMGNQDDLALIAPTALASQIAAGVDFTRFYEPARTADVPRAFMTMLHDLVFHHDARSDGAVRLASQTGGVTAPEPIPAVLHSYSAWTYAVQSRVIRALKWEEDLFDPAGFPAAGQLTERYLPSQQLSEGRVDGARAINWSGMVPAHAEQYLNVADAQDTIVLVRPINADSTQLLADGAAAKGMPVKGKSASWGPQSGFIPVEQRFSKLWVIFTDPARRDEAITRYNAQVVKSLTQPHPEYQGLTFAVARDLMVTDHAGTSCAVVTDPLEPDAAAAVMLRCGDSYFDWRNGAGDRLPTFDAGSPLPALSPAADVVARLQPLQVLADPTQDHQPYLTADYDLLAIGFRDFDGTHGPPEDVQSAPFHDLRGAISDRQWALVDAINRAVQANACYISGQVTHHGPENQYAGSPYVDYPILVFDPGTQQSGDGEVYLVRQGPPGFRDIHLKRLFAEKIREGFDLWPNPVSDGWQWEARQRFAVDLGYDPRDAATLSLYIEEAPEPAERTIRMPDACEPVQAEPDRGKEKAFEMEVAESPGATTAPAASDTELALWNAVSDSQDARQLQAYLDLFPQGVFAPLAQIKLEALVGDDADTVVKRKDDAATPQMPSEPTSIHRVFSDMPGYGVGMAPLPGGGVAIAVNILVDGAQSQTFDPAVIGLSSSAETLWVWRPANGGGGMIRAFAGLDNGGMLVLWRQHLPDTDRAAINLTRLGADGLEQWSRQQTALRADVGMLEMVAMPGGGAAVSYTLGGNAEVTRMAPDGSTVWSRSDLVGSGQGVNGLAADGEDLMVLVRHYSFDLEEPETFTLSRLGPDGTSTAPLPLELEADNFTPLVLKPDGAGGVLVQGEIYKGNYESSRALIRHIGPDGQSRWGSLAYPGHYNAPAGMVNLPDGTLLTIVNVSPTAELTQFRARLVVINASGDELDEGWLEAPGRQAIVVDVLPAGDDRLVVFALIGDPDDPTRTYPWLLTLVSQEDWLDLPRFQSPVESD